ncbi:PhnD/SsuA/transferrin family substrate-binding protein [Thiomicrorhabdus sp. Milos-T2]|uniref:PhnD/SsuA/transferrin family substrate-binding protein n=1 Tax=Thiomicrorhabdus sp. Milos-T2 TaxID=90814 RepID=UPI000A47388A|nr:PhnD/SsuA/transferrin family substrate-binding protein [Thiomicrorhabdus sp. Milos-T2]
MGVKQVTIGVLAYKGKIATLSQWTPTAKYLSNKIPSCQFTIVPLTLEEINQAINKEQLDFVLTNPGHYIQLQAKNNVTAMATLKTSYINHALEHYGAVIFTRKDAHLDTIKSLKNHSLAAVGEGAFGGFQLAEKVFSDFGIDVKKDLNIKWLGFPQSDIVQHVLSGKTDVGIVRTGILEKMTLKDGISLEDFKVIAPKKSTSFPFVHSSQLYPEWPLASVPKTNTKLAKKVLIALLEMRQDSIPARASDTAGWTIPLNYQIAKTLLKELKIPPFEPQAFDLNKFWHLYSYWIMAISFLFLMCVLFIVFILKENRKLLGQQQQLTSQRDQQILMIQQRTNELIEINRVLQQDIEFRIQSEKTINNGCEFLHELYNISTRFDLEGKEKLQSILDLTRKYLGVESAILSRFENNQFNLCIFSSSKEVNKAPCSMDYGNQAIIENKVVVHNGQNKWKTYIALPVFVSGTSGCLFEFVTEQQGDINLLESQELAEFDLRILNVLAFWASNEIIRIDNEDSNHNQLQILQKQFLDLTSREKEVLKLVVDGEPNKNIARILKISPKTVELHRANLLRKTKATSTIQLVKQAILSGIVNPT